MNRQSDTGLSSDQRYSRLTHGLSVLLIAIAFPLIWLGGLVTTYGAGMAVPDWPNTYGWNMFLYPPSTWLYGGFDLMVEHGHRLLASVAGLIAIALWVASLLKDSRRWFRWWCGLVLGAVIFQGMLGGVRVLLDERIVAMFHGCVAQLFLAMVTATAVMSSRWWIDGAKNRMLPPASTDRAAARQQPAGKLLAAVITVLLVFAYCQVIAGAQLRHVSDSVRPELFMAAVHIHLLFASLVLLVSILAVTLSASSRHLLGGVRLPVFLILAVVAVQISLGCGTWLVNYALPWQELNGEFARYTISSKGYWESVIVTSHVATGAVLVSLATLSCVRAWRSRAVWREDGNEIC